MGLSDKIEKAVASNPRCCVAWIMRGGVCTYLSGNSSSLYTRGVAAVSDEFQGYNGLQGGRGDRGSARLGCRYRGKSKKAHIQHTALRIKGRLATKEVLRLIWSRIS